MEDLEEDNTSRNTKRVRFNVNVKEPEVIDNEFLLEKD